MKFQLIDLVIVLETQSLDFLPILHLPTGNVYLLRPEELHIAEDGHTEYAEALKARVALATHYLTHNEEYLSLPTQAQINERGMMADFISRIADAEIRTQLHTTLIADKGHTKFAAQTRILGIDQAWYAFRRVQYVLFARDWCEQNHLVYIDI